MPPKTAGTYKVTYRSQPSNIKTYINVYASSPASARQIVGKRFGLNETDIIGAELVANE